MNNLGALILSVFLLHAGLSPNVQAADKKEKEFKELTQEERVKHADMMEKMAEAHKKMAECLRSDKSTKECHEEMKKDCPMAKDNHCPMMEEMHYFHRMHHHHKNKGQ